jgi:hypothetical protein
MTNRLGHGRKIVRVEVLKAIEPGEGYLGFIVMIEGGRADEVPERVIIDSVLTDSQGKIYMPEEIDEKSEKHDIAGTTSWQRWNIGWNTYAKKRRIGEK